MCVLHDDDHPVAKELVLSLILLTGRDFWCGTTLEMMMQFAVAYF
jgi:hypothetical protein